MADELTEARRALRVALADLDRKAARIRRALESLEFDGLDNAARRKERAPGSEGVYEAVRGVIASLEPGAQFTAESLDASLREGGFHSQAADPINALRSVLSKLFRAGEIERAGRGIYRAASSEPKDEVPPEPAPPDPVESEDDPWQPSQADNDAWKVKGSAAFAGVSSGDDPPF